VSAELSYHPTPVHAVADVQDTPDSWLWFRVAGLAADSVAHTLPARSTPSAAASAYA
jgi:hypothetical protein